MKSIIQKEKEFKANIQKLANLKDESKQEAFDLIFSKVSRHRAIKKNVSSIRNKTKNSFFKDGVATPDPSKTIGISLLQSQWDAIDEVTGGRNGRRSRFIQDAVDEKLATLTK